MLMGGTLLYRIDLTTILRVFARQSGRLDTEIKRVPGIKEHCHAQLFLSEGKVVSCVIEGNNGVLLSGESALHLLQNIGMLEWTYTPTPQSAPSPPVSPQLSPIMPFIERSPANAVVLFPTRIRLIQPQEFALWSRWLRSVYNLTDGSKSVDDIARVLSQPRERVLEALSELQKQEAIILLPAPRSQ
jgi:hypothetical protein